MKFDFWYGDKLEDITRAICFFNDITCTYSGYLYIGDKCVGDFYCSDSVTIGEYFPGIFDRL